MSDLGDEIVAVSKELADADVACDDARKVVQAADQIEVEACQAANAIRRKLDTLLEQAKR